VAPRLLVLLIAGSALAACGRGPSPTATYVAYRAAFEQAKAVDELLPFMDRASRARVAASPEDERRGGFEALKSYGALVDVAVLGETVTGDSAVVEATAVQMSDGGGVRGTVQLVREDGAWRIQQEKWVDDAQASRPSERTCPQLVGDLAGDALVPRIRAAAALRFRGCAEAVPVLVARLSDPVKSVRDSAASGLGQSIRAGDPAEHAALVPTLAAAKARAAEGRELVVELGLQNAIAALGAPGIPQLQADLQSPTREIRWGAASSLGMMGPRARAALPALRAASAEEKDETVNERLTAAIAEVRR
jgi:HEAT repeat protein